MLGLITESITYLFPGGRSLKLIKGGVNITNSSNPLPLAKNITLTVVDCCAPPPVKLAAHCIGAGAVMMPLPPTIHRLSPIEQDRILSTKNYYPQIAHILEEKVDKIRLTN